MTTNQAGVNTAHAHVTLVVKNNPKVTHGIVSFFIYNRNTNVNKELQVSRTRGILKYKDAKKDKCVCIVGNLADEHLYCLMSRSKILHSYNDVTLADNELQTLGVCSLPMALIKKEESVPHLL